MKNERITEDIVRNHFKSDPLFNIIKLEEQKSGNRKANELLQKASKSGSGKAIGRPEFILSFPTQNSDYLIVIECKADVSKHEAPKGKPANVKDYAVDGVKHYCKLLSEDFDIIGIAVSGQTTNEIKVSTFRWVKGNDKPKNENTGKLLSINDYLKLFDNESFSENLKTIDIIQKAVYLNEEFHSYSITEYGRCTIVSGVLLSLLDKTFKKSYATYETSEDLGNGLIEALKRVLKNSKVRNKDSMLAEFQKIINEPLFKQKKINRAKEEKITIEVIKDFIDYIHKNVYPLITMDEAGLDVLGKFYTEFIRYAGSSQKQGLVLTPFHITDFFCDLANLTADSVVYDPCLALADF